jgi:hypothetical protein
VDFAAVCVVLVKTTEKVKLKQMKNKKITLMLKRVVK